MVDEGLAAVAGGTPKGLSDPRVVAPRDGFSNSSFKVAISPAYSQCRMKRKRCVIITHLLVLNLAASLAFRLFAIQILQDRFND